MPRIDFLYFEDLVSKKRLGIALLIVVAVHALLIWLGKHSASERNTAKPPDLVIDLGQAPRGGAVGGGASQPTPAPPTTPPSVKPALGQAAAPVDPRPSSPVSQVPATPSESATSASTLLSNTPALEPAPQGARTVPSEPATQAAQERGAPDNAANDVVRTVEADYKAAYLNNPRPAYPRMAYRMGIEGTVVLLADVNEEGQVLQVRISQSSGNDLIDQSALSAVNQWRFSPAKKDGVVVRSLIKIPITFSLKTPAKK